MPHLAKRFLFRLHWLLGIPAGLVLAVVGTTGALLGFEHELTSLMNPAFHLGAPARGEAHSIDASVAAARAARPDLQVRGIAWEGDDEALIVRMGRGRERGGIELAVDPGTGHVLGTPRGKAFFETVERLHRDLAAGPVGKQLVGASTAILIVLAVTGIVLRWPRRPWSPSAWLKLDFRLRGRGLLRHLHSVLATWALAAYLLAALTGLWWSYGVYRDAVNRMAGVTTPMRRPPRGADSDSIPAPSLDAAWATFRREVPDADRAALSLPAAGAPVEIRYQTPASPHERAWDTIRIGVDGIVAGRERYADLPRGRRFVSSLFPLHSGGFFGWPGRVLMAIAAALMPFFAVTGLWMWFARRRNERARRAAHPNASTIARGNA